MRKLITLVRKGEPEHLARSREAEEEGRMWQEITRRIIEDSRRGSPGPLLTYVRGAGKRERRL